MNEKREFRLYEIMDKYNVDMDVAELMLQDEEEQNGKDDHDTRVEI